MRNDHSIQMVPLRLSLCAVFVPEVILSTTDTQKNDVNVRLRNEEQNS